MEITGDVVDFVPDRSQLARVAAPPAGTPPAWLAVAAVAGALGLSLSTALPPATHVAGGAITRVSAEDTPQRPGEVLRPPAGHDEPFGN